ncbi:MAG: hypothetical protein H0Z38_09280 [Firmicutes bacterium]|nr:hypothetical protein [Bacillota bacterium]
MKTDGILTFTAEYKRAMSSGLRQVLSRDLLPGEALIFLDFAVIHKRFGRRPAFLVLTSRRFLFFEHDLFQVKQVAGGFWVDLSSLEMVETPGIRFLKPKGQSARLVYSTESGEETVLFNVGRPGVPDKTETLVKNLSLRFKVGEKQVYTVGDTIIITDGSDFKHVRLRHWVFDLAPDYRREGLLALLTNEAVIRQRLHNLLYLNLSGEVCWRADLPTSRGTPDSYLKIQVGEETIKGHTWSGLICELNPKDGCITGIQRIPGVFGPGKNDVDIEVVSEDNSKKALLLYAGEDRLENGLYRLFVPTTHLFKERLFGSEACWSPDGRYLAVQEVFLGSGQGIQSVGIVVFDLANEKEALVEKSVSRSFIPQGWSPEGKLIFGRGRLSERGETKMISMEEVFWLPLKNPGCSERTRKY